MTISSDALKALPCRRITFIEPPTIPLANAANTSKTTTTSKNETSSSSTEEDEGDISETAVSHRGEKEWSLYATPDRPIQIRFLFDKKVVVLVIGVTQYIFKQSKLFAIDVVPTHNLWRIRWWADVQMKTVRPDGVQDGGVDHTAGRIFQQRCLSFQLIDSMAAVQNYDLHYTPSFFSYPVWRHLLHIYADRHRLSPAIPAPLWSASLFSIDQLGLVLDRPDEIDRLKLLFAQMPQLDVVRLGGNSMSGYVMHELCRMLSQSPCLNAIRKLSLRNLFHGRTVLDRIKALQHLNTLLQTQCASLIELELSDNSFQAQHAAAATATTSAAATKQQQQSSSSSTKLHSPPPPLSASSATSSNAVNNNNNNGNGATNGPVTNALDLLRAALPLLTMKRLEILRAANCELGEEGGAMFGNWLVAYDSSKPSSNTLSSSGNTNNSMNVNSMSHHPNLANVSNGTMNNSSSSTNSGSPMHSGSLASAHHRQAHYDGPPFRVIDLSRNFMTDACAKALAEGLAYLSPTLQALQLAHNGLTSAGLSVMIENGLRLCTQLMVLDLNDNPLGDASAAQVLLGGINCWPRLRVLKLNRSRVNMTIFLQGLPYVARALEELEVAGNRLNEEHLDQILMMCPPAKPTSSAEPSAVQQLQQPSSSTSTITTSMLDVNGNSPSFEAKKQALSAIPTLASSMAPFTLPNGVASSLGSPEGIKPVMSHSGSGLLRYVDVTGSMRCPDRKAMLRARLPSRAPLLREGATRAAVIEDGAWQRYGLRDGWSCEDNADATPVLDTVDTMPGAAVRSANTVAYTATTCLPIRKKTTQRIDDNEAEEEEEQRIRADPTTGVGEDKTERKEDLALMNDAQAETAMVH